MKLYEVWSAGNEWSVPVVANNEGEAKRLGKPHIAGGSWSIDLRAKKREDVEVPPEYNRAQALDGWYVVGILRRNKFGY